MSLSQCRASPVAGMFLAARMAGLVWPRFQEPAPEPHHGSKGVRYWIKGIRLPSQDQDRFLAVGVSMGDPAVSCVVHEVEEQSAPIKRSFWCRALWNCLPSWAQERVPALVACGGKVPALI